MGRLITLAPTPPVSSQSSTYNLLHVAPQASTSCRSTDFPTSNFITNQNQVQSHAQQVQLHTLSPQTSTIFSQDSINSQLNNIMNANSSLVVPETNDQTPLPFQLPNQGVTGLSNLNNTNVPCMSLSTIAPIAAVNSLHLPVSGTQNILMSSPPTQGNLPPINLLPQTPHHPVAEFLFQLTKMLTDDNRVVIEWTSGKIIVHDPQKLADTVLHKYFRHSKYASFQRQLNYFGFRKIAGKGKMSPCSYVNDAATQDLRSLLFIKRKTNSSAGKKNSDKNRDVDGTKRNEPESSKSEADDPKKRKLEYHTDEGRPLKQQLKKIPDIKPLPSVERTVTAKVERIEFPATIEFPSTIEMPTHNQTQGQNIPYISQVPVQIIPRVSQPKGAVSLQSLNLPSSTTIQTPCNEHLHFPSEKSFAFFAPRVITDTKYNTPAMVSSETSLFGSEDSLQATTAVNDLKNCQFNESTFFDSSLGASRNRNSESQLKNSILSNWDSLFPDSVNLSSSVKDSNCQAPNMDMKTMSSMLSRDSSLVDLAMLPTHSMLDIFRFTQKSAGASAALPETGLEPNPVDESKGSIDQFGGIIIG